ncbi:B12-binding domain-containing radical SAM protein [Myxococcota bacterium]|nr:B12-binding domain-containing radical SAM protein [Myxococcota bacterium]MBU1382345.1 B12-binding domain-containing radical SAM protein [Myxococcota bacterium]MBU1496425.1 B12-binding domain-containing radical SAM protein [Myxococcota bacterium]
MSTLVTLVTINARYHHRSAALQTLKANAGNLIDSIEIMEFSLEDRPEDIVEKIIESCCRIVGFSVYIWNYVEILRVVSLLKKVAPDIITILGGPEASFEYENSEIFELTDYLICGEGEEVFPQLCSDILAGRKPDKVIVAEPCDLKKLKFPDVSALESVAGRIVYIETSRGCPFNCHFCISGEDKRVRRFETEQVIDYLGRLYETGLNHYKFLDRSMVNGPYREVLQWFATIDSSDISVHFELNPDSIPPSFFEELFKLRKMSIQLELGIQTFNEEVLERIGRKQNNDLAVSNIGRLLEKPNIHIHSDIIAGLPGESLDSISQSFDTLYFSGVHEIQFGILKRLKGAAISKHTDEFSMVYSSFPPYNVLSTSTISFNVMQKLRRFARYLDLVFNSGNFYNSSRLIMGDRPFVNFMEFTKWLWKGSGQTHKLSRDRLAAYIFNYLNEKAESDSSLVIKSDYERLNHIFPSKILEPESPKRPVVFFRRQKKHSQGDGSDNRIK